MFPGCIDPTTGRINLRNGPPVSPAFNHGVAFGPNFVYAFNAAPIGYVNGLSIADAVGSLAITPTSDISHFQNGLPYATDVLAVEDDAAAYYSNGLPFTAAGKLAVQFV